MAPHGVTHERSEGGATCVLVKEKWRVSVMDGGMDGGMDRGWMEGLMRDGGIEGWMRDG